MTDINSYVEYFRTLAREHKEINDFYMMDINEPLDALRSNIKYPALILTSLSGNFEASNLDNILDLINGGFLIIGHLDQIDDFSGVLNSLPVLYPYVYQQKGDAGSEDNGWASLIISLADGKTDDKSLETVMNSNLYNVLIGLNKKSKEYHEYMSKIESYDRH